MRHLGRSGIRLLSRLVMVATVAMHGLSADVALLAQSGSDEHWVGTWATATVARDPQPEGDGFGGGGGSEPASLELQ